MSWVEGIVVGSCVAAFGVAVWLFVSACNEVLDRWSDRE